MLIFALVAVFLLPSCATACGGNFTVSSATIQSPGYPGNYDNDLDCVYVIRRPVGERITVTFSYFDLEGNSNSTCLYDFLKLRDGSSSISPLISLFCGTDLPTTRRSFQNSMYIHFHTDNSVTRTGFRLTYTSAVMKNNFFLIPSSSGGIFRMDVGTISNVVIPNITAVHPVAADFDPVEQRLYWTDVMLKIISSADLNGGGQRVLRTLSSNSTPDGIAVDPVSRLVFYTDTGNNVIAMMTLSGSLHRTIINTDLDEPRAIVLDTINGVMFWTDWGTPAKIERANYDGSDRRTLHSGFLIYPNALALDLNNNRIYWVDAGTDWVEYSDLNGNSRTQIFTFQGSHFFGLAYHDNYLYVTDWTSAGAQTSVSAIRRLNIVDRSSETIGSGSFRMNDIHIYIEDEWQKGPNGCSNNNGGCSHFCVPSPGLRSRCVCPDAPTPCVEEISTSTTTSTTSTTTTSSATSSTASTTTNPPTTTTAQATTTTPVRTSSPTTSPTTTLSLLSVTLDGPSLLDTDGRQAVTLTCDPDNRKPVLDVTWSVPCSTETDRKCVWTPLVPEDDGTEVTCRIRYTDGQLGIGSLTVSLNYPPPDGPMIQGYNKGDKLKEGDSLVMTCLVRGGKPLVTSVHFSCPGHPDSQTDIRGDSQVQSLLTIDPLRATDDGKRCVCTAEWKVGELYLLSATRILMVNVSESAVPPSAPQTGLPVAAVGGGVAAGVVVLIAIVAIVIFFILRRRRTTEHGTVPGKSPYERPVIPSSCETDRNPYSTLGGSSGSHGSSQPDLKDQDYSVRFSEIYDEIAETPRNSVFTVDGLRNPTYAADNGVNAICDPKLPDYCKTIVPDGKSP